MGRRRDVSDSKRKDHHTKQTGAPAIQRASSSLHSGNDHVRLPPLSSRFSGRTILGSQRIRTRAHRHACLSIYIHNYAYTRSNFYRRESISMPDVACTHAYDLSLPIAHLWLSRPSNIHTQSTPIASTFAPPALPAEKRVDRHQQI